MAWQVRFPHLLPTHGCAVVIGNFDGVHAGHRHLLAVAQGEAQARNLPLVVLTFEPHPRSVLRPGVPLKRLSSPEGKVDLLREAGVDGVAVLDFTLETASWSPERFMQDVLVDWLDAQVVCVGENFRFGHKAGGDVAVLATHKKFTTRAVPLFEDEAGVVSSSRLRALAGG